MQEKLKSPLFIALAAALLCVATGATSLANHIYWNVLYKISEPVGASDAVIVTLDDAKPVSASSIAASTGAQAKLVDGLLRQNPKAIYFDYPNAAGTNPLEDEMLVAALMRGQNKITLVNRAEMKIIGGEKISGVLPQTNFSHPATLRQAASNWSVNFLGYVEPTSMRLDGIPGDAGLASVVSVANPTLANGSVIPDLRIKPELIKTVSGKALLAGMAPPQSLAGKIVFVTSTNPNLDTAVRYPGHTGKVPSAIADIAGSEGKLARLPFDPGDWPLLALFLLTIIAGNKLRYRWARLAIYSALPIALVALPELLRSYSITVNFGAAIIALVVYAPLRSIQKWRSEVQLASNVSGLPNAEALARDGVSKSQDVVAVMVSQYEHILASLPPELHGECARQIARRLSLGAGDRKVYDCDNGHFVWLEDSRTLDEIVGHLEGLRALFAAPLAISEHKLDTTIHFGLDRNGDNRASARAQAALASAGEAQSKGKLYEEFGHQRLAQSPWELSLHARIDEGLQNGDIWLALQPQFDLRTDRISGAEALIRWNDPERGVIPPDAFILQAERAGRIESITYWVLTKAIAMSRQLNQIAAPFQISVNLSARMVDHPDLVRKIADIVRENPVDCSLITLEVTETFSMANREAARDNLATLRSMGFRLSIDDFGTGQASLAYLAEIPSDEIKLDRRFVQAINSDPRERCIVDSVIRLAHELGQEVVAEGIEDAATLKTLWNLGCDIAQGYHVGRPIAFADFQNLLAASRSKTATA